MLENHQLKSENEKLKRKLKHRSKQVKVLSQDVLHQKDVMKQHKERLQNQRSQTEVLQMRLQGLTLAVQGWETEPQKGSKAMIEHYSELNTCKPAFSDN